MILDNDLRLATALDMSTSGDVTSSYDLGKSPDVGTGQQLVFLVKVDTYTAGASTATVFDVVTSSTSNLTTTPRVIGSVTVPTAQMVTAAADGTMPIVVRVNPIHDGNDTTGVAERYIGLEANHTTAVPSALTVTVDMALAEGYQSDPTMSHQDSGFTIA